MLSVAPGDPATWKIQGLFNTLQIPEPLFRKNADRFYCYEYLARAKALYVQYASCQDDSKQLFADFTRDMFAFADCHPVERVIVDLRFNGRQTEVHARLLGEPASEKLNSYGEVRFFQLPNSRLRVQYSTKFFRLARNGDESVLQPDVMVGRTLADVLAGRDPVLDAALQRTER